MLGARLTSVVNAEAAFDTGSVLKLPDDSISARNLVPEPSMKALAGICLESRNEGVDSYIGPMLGAAWARIPERPSVCLSVSWP